MTDSWDPSIPEHKEIAHQIEYGNGIPCMRPIRESLAAFDEVGFEILHKDDLADKDDPVPWYYPLEGKLLNTQCWTDIIDLAKVTFPVRWFAQISLFIMEFIGLVPKGTAQVCMTLMVALMSLKEGGQKKVSMPFSGRTIVDYFGCSCLRPC